jgi:hypothetical protein
LFIANKPKIQGAFSSSIKMRNTQPHVPPTNIHVSQLAAATRHSSSSSRMYRGIAHVHMRPKLAKAQDKVVAKANFN